MNDKTEKNAGNDDSGYDSLQTVKNARIRAEEGEFRIGDRIIGRYEVREILGQGGMGIVYKCFDTVTMIDIALKTLPPEVERSHEEMEEIKANFRLMGKLAHPNIAAMRTIEEKGGRCFLVMDYRWNGNDPLQQYASLLSSVSAAPLAGPSTMAEMKSICKDHQCDDFQTDSRNVSEYCKSGMK